MRLLPLLVVALLGFVGCVGASKDFKGLKSLANINKYQLESGGFVSVLGDAEPSLESTAAGLFLASLYGIRTYVNMDNAARYIQSLENGDFGFSNRHNLASDLNSVLNAVVSFHHIGDATHNSKNLFTFINSLWNANDSLFANQAGDAGSIKATADAFQTLELISELQNPALAATIQKVKALLSKSLNAEKNGFSFKGSSLSPLAQNYYGVVVGSLVGFEFANPQNWVNYISEFQLADRAVSGFGGFRSSKDGVVSAEASSQAIASIFALKAVDKFRNVAAFGTYISNVDEFPTIESIAAIHRAFAQTPYFKEYLSLTPLYQSADGNMVPEGALIVEGTSVRPALRVLFFDALPFGGQNVEVSVTLPGKPKPDVVRLPWNLEAQAYVADQFLPTAGVRGNAVFAFSVTCNVATIGQLVFTEIDERPVGLNVGLSKSVTSGGKDLTDGESVTLGTDFKFEVDLSNKTDSSILQGDFSVELSVTDSSKNTVHSASVSLAAGVSSISFEYSLKSATVVPGPLAFAFGVRQGAALHSVATETYDFTVPLVATKVTFDKDAKALKLGDDFKVSMEPAAFPDMRTVQPYDEKALSNLKFSMEVSSPKGVSLQSVAGTVQKNKVVFATSVPFQLSQIGAHVISFNYIPAVGTPIKLLSYDSKFSELYEDGALNYTVRANLQFAKAAKTVPSGSYKYGDKINLEFALTDTVSNKAIAPVGAEVGQASIAVALRSSAGVLSSVHEKAALSNGQFSVSWAVSPNARSGAGSLVVLLYDVDGNAVTINNEAGKPASYDITVAGKISSEIDSRVLPAASESLFVVKFHLSCEKAALADAVLSSSVEAPNGEVTVYPVASGENGAYEISWNLPNARAASGTYKVSVFRDGDSGEALFTHDVEFHQSFASVLGNLRTQLVAAALLCAVFVWLSLKKSRITKTGSSSSKKGN